MVDVLEHLVDAGNTVLAIVSITDVIKMADRIIDMGLRAGDGGGTVVAHGTPEQVAKKWLVYGEFLTYPGGTASVWLGSRRNMTKREKPQRVQKTNAMRELEAAGISLTYINMTWTTVFLR